MAKCFDSIEGTWIAASMLADRARIVLAGIVDAQKVGRADTMGNGAEIGVGGNAARKLFATIMPDTDLAEQLDFDVEFRVFTFRPLAFARLHRIGKRDDAVASDGNGDQPADGPEFGEIGVAMLGDSCDRRMRAVAGDDTAQHPVTDFLGIATLLLPGRDRTVKVVVQQQ
jgi:hypothetical protein